MKKNLIINGRPLSFWENGDYKIKLIGGGNINGQEENNYILKIENIDTDFNIVFEA